MVGASAKFIGGMSMPAGQEPGIDSVEFLDSEMLGWLDHEMGGSRPSSAPLGPVPPAAVVPVSDAHGRSEVPPLGLGGAGSGGGGSSSGGGWDMRQVKAATAILLEGRGEPLALPVVFELLLALRAEDPATLDALPRRASASPLAPGAALAYVVCRRLCRPCDVDAAAAAGEGRGISVTFQSILNSEIWWAPAGGLGVAARPMGRSARAWVEAGENGGTARTSRSTPHGYRGRLYSLVARSDEPMPARKRSRRGEVETRVKTLGDIAVMHAWRAEGDADSSLASSEEAPLLSPSDPPFTRDPSTGDLHLPRNMRVRGNVYVDGVVFGKLATPPNAADYAEWFAWRDEYVGLRSVPDDGDVEAPPPLRPEPPAVGAHKVKGGAVVAKKGGAPAKVYPGAPDYASLYLLPPPGSVVQLRSPEQRLTLDTSGDGPCMIVSTSPSVAAGTPVDPRDAAKGAFVAFLGQVPVRVRGVVRAGDQLVPSGLHDGVAVAAVNDRPDDVLGVAMEHSPSETDDDFECVVRSFVRWNHAVRREIRDEYDEMKRGVQSRNVTVLLDAQMTVGLVLVGLEIVSLFVLTAMLFLGGDSRLRTAVWRARLEGVICCLASVNLFGQMLLYALFIDRYPRRAATVAVAGGAIVLGVVHTSLARQGAGIGRAAHYAFNAAWQLLGITYFLVCYSQAKILREAKLAHSWACLAHPTTISAAKKALPIVLFLAILSLVIFL